MKNETRKLKLQLISVEERLPTMEELKRGLFGFHVSPDGEAEGTMVFYTPDYGWAKIGEPNEKHEYPMVNVDDEVDYWAVIPDEFWN